MKFMTYSLGKAFDPAGKKRVFFLCYTFIFLITSFFIFLPFILGGISLIWNTDGWIQHYKAMVYYSEYLRDIFGNLFEGKGLIIPDWDFYIGEGSDITNTFHYYVIGDPIAFLCVLFPREALPQFYSFSCILRMYLAGIAFQMLCFGMGQKNRCGIMTATAAYVFCYWQIYNVARHPYFLNPLLYFPLLVLGFEKIIRKERPYLFVVMTALSALCNFYFFYMYVILLFIYALIRLGYKYKKDIRGILAAFLRTAVYAVTGVLIAGIIILPALLTMLGDSRINIDQPFHLFYSFSYYTRLPAIALTSVQSYWLCMGFPAPVFLAVFLLFVKRRQGDVLKTLFILCGLVIIFPIGGRVLNGMSYMANRWSWVLALLACYTLSQKWEELMNITKKELKTLSVICTVIYALLMLFDRSRISAALAAAPLFFAALLAVAEIKKEWKKQVAVFAVTICGVLSAAFWHFSPTEGDYVNECVKYSDIDVKWQDNEAAAVRKLAGDGFVRLSGRDLTYNANIFSDVSSTQFYWSMSNPYTGNFRNILALKEPLYQSYQGYDDRTSLLALSSVNYYTLQKESELIPYGYSLASEVLTRDTLEEAEERLKTELGVNELNEDQIEKLRIFTTQKRYIYKNQYPLPLAYTYSSCIPKNVWDRMDPVQKQEAMLEAAYVENIPEGIKKLDHEMPDFSAGYELIPANNEVTVFDGGLITTAVNAKVTLKFDEPAEDSEIYVAFYGLNYKTTREYEMYSKDKDVDPFDIYNDTLFDLLDGTRRYNMRMGKINEAITDDDAYITASLPGIGSKELNYKQPDNNPSGGRHDFVVNLGYAAKESDRINLSFKGRGRYTYDRLVVYKVPMTGYREKIKALKEDKVTKLDLGDDTVSMRVDAKGDRILCLATPYAGGWTAWVDGKAAEVMLVNDRYLGVSVSEGKHSVSFRYRAPYKFAGAGVSLIGVLSFALEIVIGERKRKKRKSDAPVKE